MSQYELVTIIDSLLADDKKQSINQQAAEAITKNGGNVTSNQLWLDKNKMTFRIKKVSDATYHMLKFDAPTSAVDKIKRALTLNEELVRFGIFRVEQS